MTESDERSWWAAPRSFEEARKQVRDTALAFVAVGAFQGVVGFFVAPAVMYDAVILSLGGLWLRRTPRLSVAVGLALMAVVAAGVTVANKLGADMGGGSNIYLVLPLVVLSIQVVRGTLAYHRLAAVEDAEYQRPSRWPGVVVISGLSVSLGLFAAGLMMEPERLVSGESVSDEIHALLASEQLLEEGEEIVYFFSTPGDGYRDFGTLLTSLGVISYAVVDGEMLSGWYDFSDIAGFHRDEEDSWWDVWYMTVEGTDGESLIVALPSEETEVILFIDALNTRLRDPGG